MPLLSKKYLDFDEEDVKLMQTMMKQFYQFHKGTETPDFANNYVGYLPIFAVALLASQEAVENLSEKLLASQYSVEKLSKKLLALTVVIAVFTIVLAVLTLILLFKTP